MPPLLQGESSHFGEMEAGVLSDLEMAQQNA